jgi:hypothetical protein
MPAPVALLATAAVTVGAVSVIRSVRLALARGRRLGLPRQEEVYDLIHDPATDTYLARRRQEGAS